MTKKTIGIIGGMGPLAIATRLKAYHESTEPLIGYYTGLGKLRRVNGDNQLEEVFKAILASLE